MAPRFVAHTSKLCRGRIARDCAVRVGRQAGRRSAKSRDKGEIRRCFSKSFPLRRGRNIPSQLSSWISRESMRLSREKA